MAAVVSADGEYRSFDANELQFYATERARVVQMLGVNANYDEISTELKRRWKVMQDVERARNPVVIVSVSSSAQTDAPVDTVSRPAPIRRKEKNNVIKMLETLKKDSLNDICVDFDLNTSGNKAALVERIYDKHGNRNPRRLLNELMKDTLQSICEDFDVPISGNKPELVDRICEAI